VLPVEVLPLGSEQAIMEGWNDAGYIDMPD